LRPPPGTGERFVAEKHAVDRRNKTMAALQAASQAYYNNRREMGAKMWELFVVA
jgi:hypothetical protein